MAVYYGISCQKIGDDTTFKLVHWIEQKTCLKSITIGSKRLPIQWNCTPEQVSCVTADQLMEVAHRQHHLANWTSRLPSLMHCAWILRSWPSSRALMHLILYISNRGHPELSNKKKYVSVTILVAEISYPCIILNMQLPSGIDQESQQEIVFDNMASTKWGMLKVYFWRKLIF